MTSLWMRWRLKSPASWLFTQPFIQGADQRKHQNSASLAFVRRIHRRPVNSPHKRPLTRKMFPFDDIMMIIRIVFITPDQFWLPGIVVACVRPSVLHQVCPRDSSSPGQVRLTKFGPKMQNTLVKVPIVLGSNRPWPPRSHLTLKSKFIPFWACPHHNSSSIQARITNFGLEMPRSLNFINLHPLHVLIYLDNFTVPTVSQSRHFACIMIWAAEVILAFNVVLV